MNFHQLFKYDQWANELVFEVVAKEIETERFSEVNRHFSHLLIAQHVWFGRVSGNLSSLGIWDRLTAVEMQKLIIENPKSFQAIKSQQNENISYINSIGDSFVSKVEDILMHLIIHSQHHRAQIALLLRELGITPPATDYIYFTRSL